jgi:hypothetical protein
VPTVTTTGIARIISFQNPGLFESFGLPQENRPAGRSAAIPVNPAGLYQ